MNFLTRVLSFGLLLQTALSLPSYRYHTTLDTGGQLTLDWDVDRVQQKVKFRLTAKLDHHKNRWFGLGFSDYGMITDADFAVYWTDTRVHHFQDCWTDDRGLLHVDRHQDFILMTSSIDKGRRILEFQRRYDTCDAHDYIIENGTTHILFFIGESSPQSLEGVALSDLGVQITRVQLLKPEIPVPVYPSDTWIFDVTTPSITVPDTDTTYWWYLTRLPHLSDKHHIIKYESVIQRGSEHLVHHMEVFQCEIHPDDDIKPYNGPGMAEGKPPELSTCRNVIGAWAMGSGPFILPPDAGIPIGERSASSFILLEIHYNNPNLLKGIVDSSGIRFYVTRHLRRHDAGIMELGLEYTNKMAVPPGQTSFPLRGYCIAECTKVGLGHHSIHIYGSQLHTHMTGRKVYTKHLREGVELPELNRDNHYSPHFQEIRRLPVPVEIRPGDALVTTCDYHTEDRPNVTVGGFSIKDEMCVNYVHYYPRTNLEVCKSSIQTSSLHKFFSFLNVWDKADTSQTKGDRDNYSSIRWSTTTTKLLLSLYDMAPLSMQCNKSDGTRFPGVWESAQKPLIYLPLPKPKSRCRRLRLLN
ncbi:dopamine beta-hydroxylase-like [Mizuhopecten yessoensis]|uniref:Dopamine beta-hydroxylase n=1 Tax=Mizuhopecten yessoensis TaxID=6573 RepID=A0A210R1A1_MIZYE|nr:dopamine beta-hydroxylase-like [Mizuhopecten yessoensis]OWF54665.1 Dopamine beta-hydroxylase [Mizuhopecten yessoensis]